jgi:hypothetical protein
MGSSLISSFLTKNIIKFLKKHKGKRGEWGVGNREWGIGKWGAVRMGV